MKTLLITAAVAVSAIAAAAPAAAQYYPAPQAYGYGYQQQYPQQQQYGYQNGPNGYQNGYAYQQQGLVRSYLVRVDRLRQRISQIDARNRISEREADGLKREASYIRNMVRAAGYNGLNSRERREIEVRLARLEQRIRYERRDGNDDRGQGYYGNNGQGWNGNGYDGTERVVIDRDRDGRDDRWERRHDRDGDGRRDHDDRDDRDDD